MARAVRLSDYTAATVMALRREASSTLHAIGLPSGLSDLGRLPDALSVLPEDVYAPNRERGNAILNGRFTLAGESLSTDGPAAAWLQPAPTRAFARRLHAFGWMRDCLAAELLCRGQVKAF